MFAAQSGQRGRARLLRAGLDAARVIRRAFAFMGVSDMRPVVAGAASA
jgi:hypothetical protein